jgi:hypothetical protein
MRFNTRFFFLSALLFGCGAAVAPVDGSNVAQPVSPAVIAVDSDGTPPPPPTDAAPLLPDTYVPPATQPDASPDVLIDATMRQIEQSDASSPDVQSPPDVQSDSQVDASEADAQPDTLRPPVLLLLSRGRPAIQSSEYPLSGPYPASYAFDGDITNFSHTNTQLEPYLVVDLGAVRTIYRMDVWNRRDCCQSFLTGYRIDVAETASAWTSAVVSPSTALRPSTHEVRVRGRYVRLTIMGVAPLHPAEFEVFGTVD